MAAAATSAGEAEEGTPAGFGGVLLYQFKTSPFAAKIRRILNYRGIPYRIREVARHEVGELAHISPGGKFPAMEWRGEAVADSTEILHFLEAAYPDRSLVPADPVEAALAHILEDWADESLYFYELTMRLSWEWNVDPFIRQLVSTMPGADPATIKPLVLEAAGATVRAQGVGRKPADAVVKDAERHFARLDDLLGSRDWLAGAAISYADIAVACQIVAMLDARECAPMFEAAPKVADWLRRVDTLAPAAPVEVP